MIKEEIERLILELENQLKALGSKRHYSKKEVRIYDSVDQKVPMLDRMYKRRLQGYRALGYETE